MSFTFRQRIGRVDWSEIDALDLESCVNARDTRMLQSLLDMVTFSEITTKDLGACGKTLVAKCIRLLQFIVEYLLYTQDAYLRSAQDKARTIEKLNHTIRGLQQENATKSEVLKWKEKESAQLKAAFQAAQDVLYELGYGPHIASQRFGEADQMQSLTQAVRQVMTTVSDNHNYQVSLLKEELAEMRSHYEKQLETFSRSQQAPAPAPAPAPVALPPEPKKYFRSMHAQTPVEFLPKPEPTTVVAPADALPEYERRIQLLQNQLHNQAQQYTRQRQYQAGQRVIQMLIDARRRKLQRRLRTWERHAHALAKAEHEQQLRDAHEKRQMLVRALHKSSKARGNIRDADVNTSISLERAQPAVATASAAVESGDGELSRLEILLRELLAEPEQTTGTRALVAQVLFSGCDADGLLEDIELRIQGNLAQARSQQQPTESMVESLWQELAASKRQALVRPTPTK